MSKKSDYFSDIILNDDEYYEICKQMVIKQNEISDDKTGKSKKELSKLLQLSDKRIDYLEERCEEIYKTVN